MSYRTSFVFVSILAASAAGCLTSGGVTPDGGAPAASTNGPGSGSDGGSGGDGAVGPDPGQNPNNADVLTYRDIATHPGCTTDGLSYPAASIPGYKCAAKAYATPASEDTTKPIVLLIHGNSSTPADWEQFAMDSTNKPMLSERLVTAGYRVFAIDMRIDKTDDPTTNDPVTGNAAHNMDHGWGVPIVEHFIESVLTAFPGRKISLVGFSFGPTAIRDALRKLHRKGVHPFERVQHLVFASGANHGVSSFRKKCIDPAAPANTTMAGRVACEMGDLVSYTPTKFEAPLNGPDDAYDTPCADGSTAYGQDNECGGHKVLYTTVVMRDPPQGALQDEFVSEGSAALKGADNQKLELSDQDLSGYFYKGLFKNHMGSIRSEHGLQVILAALAK